MVVPNLLSDLLKLLVPVRRYSLPEALPGVELMSVTIDHEPLAAEKMGLRTIGQLLSHIQRDNRLVTNLLIDGQEPDLDCISTIRHSLLNSHTLFIETADPEIMALDALDEVEAQLRETDRLRADAVEMLQRGQSSKALEKLSGCFSTWQNAQESVLKVAQLLRIDLENVRMHGLPLTGLLTSFSEQLRQIKNALENRDFVTLADILTYEANETSSQWRQAFDALREIIQTP
jgi:hypothetical protein